MSGIVGNGFMARGAITIPAFTITVKSDNAGTSGTNQFTIPTTGAGYLYDVETSDGYTASGLTGDHTITFPSGAGTYDVFIRGDFPRIYFNNGGDKLKILDIKQFDFYPNSTSQLSAFYGCNNLTITASDLGDFSLVTDFFLTWFGCSSLTSFPLINTSSGTNFSSTWRSCSSLTSFPLINTSSGTNFSFAWAECTSLTSFPANVFDGCNATNFDRAFRNTALTQASIDGILVSISTNGTSGGTFTQSGGSAPSATGETAIDALRARGWVVAVTGGY